LPRWASYIPTIRLGPIFQKRGNSKSRSPSELRLRRVFHIVPRGLHPCDEKVHICVVGSGHLTGICEGVAQHGDIMVWDDVETAFAPVGGKPRDARAPA